MDANKELFNESVGHQIDLMRYSNSAVKRMIGLLNKVDNDLFSQLTQKLEEAPESMSVKRIDAMLESVRNVNESAYADMHKRLGNELEDFTAYETDYQTNLINNVIPEELKKSAGIATQYVTPDAVYAAAVSQPFQGKLLKEYVAGLEGWKFEAIQSAVRIGFVEGETVSQITKRIRGTKARNYEDGLLETNRRGVESIVRTAISHIADFSRQAVYTANKDIVRAVRYTATLDERTTTLCASRDGNVYPIDGARPSIPAHINCRSLYTPVLKSFEELGIKGGSFSASTRASMNGQVSAKTTYAEWLANQTEQVQDRVLGKTRADLFRAGKITLKGFVNDKGQLYTLDELRALNKIAPAVTVTAKTKALDVSAGKYWPSGTTQAQFHDKAFDKAPLYIKEAIAEHDGKLNEVIKGNSSAYSSIGTRIKMKSFDVNDNHNQGTWRHEYGHFLDSKTNKNSPSYRSSEPDFIELMSQETDVIVKNSGYGRASKARDLLNSSRRARAEFLSQELVDASTSEAREEILKNYAESVGLKISDINEFFYSETVHTTEGIGRQVRTSFLIEALKTKDAALFMDSLKTVDRAGNNENYYKGNIGYFSDLVGSATKNKLLGNGAHGNGGHLNSYYNRAKSQAPTEVFANLTCLNGSGNVVWQKVVESFYPKLNALHEDILSGL